MATAACMATAGFAAEPTPPSKKVKDPNEKICETQGVLGSRLAKRRVCATRAEWAERRQRERDIVDRTQSQRCSINPATGFCGGQ
jgi:hypothetical protein